MQHWKHKLVRSSRLFRTSVIATAVATAAVAISACTSAPASPGSASGTSGAATVAFAGDKLSDAFVAVQAKELEAAAKKAGLPIATSTNADGDVAKQITDVSTLLTQGVAGLFIKPADSAAIAPAVQQANQKKVPVIAVSDSIAGSGVYMTVQSDNLAMGVQACEAMGKAVNGKGTVLNLQGDLASTGGKDRSEGFTTCMAEKFPGITVVSKPTNWKADKASAAAQTVVTTQEIAGINLASDTAMGAAVAQVLKNANKWAQVGQPGHIAIVSIDGGSVALKDIRDGYQDALISQPLNLFASNSIAYMQQALAGKQQAEGATDHGSEIRKDKFGNLVDLIPAPVVTKENVDDSTLWGNNA